MSFASIFTLIGCLALPLVRTNVVLMLIGFASCLGTYAIGSEGDGVKILPGPLFALTFFFIFVTRILVKKNISLSWDVRKWILVMPLYGLLVTILAPLIFGGRVLVIQPNLVAQGIREAVPLQWSLSSFAQGIYLFFAATLVAQAARMATKQDFNIGWSVRIHLIVATVFAVLVTSEALLNVVGFPADFFSALMGDRIGQSRVDRYALDSIFGFNIRRAQAVFGEPSFYAAYMTGVCAAALLYLREKFSLRLLLQFSLLTIALALSFSTTAFLAVTVVFSIIAFAPLSRSTQGGVLHKRRSGNLFTLFFISAFFFAVIAVLRSDELYSYLFGKLSDIDGYELGNFSSGAERLFWDITAFNAFIDSFGLGIGAGATRASSFLLNIMAAYGVLGIIVLAGLLKAIWKVIFSHLNLHTDLNLRASAALVMGWLIAAMMSVPDGIPLFYIWIQFGFILGFSLVKHPKKNKIIRPEFSRDLNA